MPKNLGNIRGVGKVVAHVGASIPKTPKVRAPRPHRPRVIHTRVRMPRAPDVIRPTTQTPTITGTGNTTTSDGFMPGVPPPSPSSGLPPAYALPKIKNWKKATPAQIAQAMLAPQYASLYAQQHQAQLMAGQQRAAITSYGADLAKIMAGTGPTGAKGTLGPDYAAALSMSAMRQFAYEQFLQSQKFSDEYAKIASQYPTYLNQILAQRAEQQTKQDALNFQKLVAAKEFGLKLSQFGLYQQKAQDQSKQAWARIGISKFNAQLAMKRYGISLADLKFRLQKEKTDIAQWNQTRTDKMNKIDYSQSRLSGRYMTVGGVDVTKQMLAMGAKPIIQVGAKTTTKPTASQPWKELGLTGKVYWNRYTVAYNQAKAAVNNGYSKQEFIATLASKNIQAPIAVRAWNDYTKRHKPAKNPNVLGTGTLGL